MNCSQRGDERQSNGTKYEKCRKEAWIYQHSYSSSECEREWSFVCWSRTKEMRQKCRSSTYFSEKFKYKSFFSGDAPACSFSLSIMYVYLFILNITVSQIYELAKQDDDDEEKKSQAFCLFGICVRYACMCIINIAHTKRRIAHTCGTFFFSRLLYMWIISLVDEKQISKNNAHTNERINETHKKEHQIS